MDDEESALARRLGLAIMRHRKRRQLTQAEVAEAADLTVNFVSYLERGVRLPSVPVLAQLARCLGVTVGILMDEATPDSWPDEAHAVLMSLPKETRKAAMLMLKGLAEERAPKTSRKTAVPRGATVHRRSTKEIDPTVSLWPERDTDP